MTEWDVRGILLDPARLTERYDSYRTLIPKLARWGINTILVHLFDHEGSALKLEHPRLLPTPGALTTGQWRALVELAGEHHITVIPELEILGHSGYLTRLEDYRELMDGKPDGHGWPFCISPAHPRTLEIVDALCRTLADIFPSPCIHIGMDESDIGANPHTERVLRDKPMWRVYSEYIAGVNEIVRGYGRRSMMWSDHLLASAALAESLPRDIIQCNWLYGEGHRDDYEETTRRLLDMGYDVIGCPAGVWYGTVLAPHRGNCDNIVHFDAACRRIGSKSVLGMISTMWCPYRHLPAIAHPIMHHAARVFSGGTGDFASTVSDLVEEEFGVRDRSGRLAAALTGLHTHRTRSGLEMSLLGARHDALAGREEDIARLGRLGSDVETQLGSCAGSAHADRDAVRQWRFTAGLLRELAVIARREMAGAAVDVASRQALAEQLRSACLRDRDYTAAGDHAPGMAPLPWENSDHPLALLLGSTADA